MQYKPIVTIICLCYNQELYVLESLSSVINQTYSKIELIIVDDCSTDNSKKVIRNWLLDYPDISFISNETNLGNTKAFNKALKIAKGDYIIDLAADDILLPHCVNKQVDKFDSSIYENLGIVYGNAEMIDENGNFISYYFNVDSNTKVIGTRAGGDEYLTILAGKKDAMCSVSAMIKKSVFDDLQGYDENLAYEDLDFWIRASRKYKFDFIDEIIMQKRTLINSLSNAFENKNNSRSKKINYSTYLIINKAIQQNKTKEENIVLLRRVHGELVLAYKNSNYKLLLKYILLKIKIEILINFSAFSSLGKK